MKEIVTLFKMQLEIRVQKHLQDLMNESVVVWRIAILAVLMNM